MQRTIRFSTVLFILLAALFVTAGTATAIDGWKISVPDGAKHGHFASHLMLPSGHPAVAYIEQATGNLMYADSDGNNWKTMVVDGQVRDGRYCSMALLPSGRPAIAYCDFVNWSLKYAAYDGFRWNVSVVDDTGMVVGHSDLAVLPSGYPAISYKCNGLKYAEFNGSTWQFAFPDSDFYAGWCTDLSIQPNGYPAISYFWDLIAGPTEICYAAYDGASWKWEVVSGTSMGLCSSLRYSSTGYPMIGYSTLQGGTSFATPASKGWSIESVSYSARFSDLAVLSTGQTVMALIDPTADELQYAYPASKGWDLEKVDDVVDDNDLQPARVPSIRLDTLGRPTIAYLDSEHNHLKYAKQTPGGWETEIAKSGQLKVGSHSSAVVLPKNRPAVCYLDESLNDLKYAVLEDGKWSYMVVDKDGGKGMSMAVLNNGMPAVSYYDNTYGHLKYAYLVDNQWKQFTIEHDAITVGVTQETFTGLAVLPTGRPAISYFYEGMLYDQKYAWCNGLSWQTSTVDKDWVGRCSSLAVLPSGRPAMTYRKEIDSAMWLIYAWFDGQEWIKSKIDQVTNGGYWTVRRENSLAILHDGLPAVAYYSESADSLKYARLSGGIWRKSFVDQTPGAGHDCSLAIMPTGHPAISYHLDGDYEYDLKYAWYAVDSVYPYPTWHTMTVDSANNMGCYSSLIVLPGGQPGIMYYNWIYKALMYAVGYELSVTPPGR
ncbi:MAG: hypothetical protein ABIK28_06485 [Planctomycetota bacterium]